MKKIILAAALLLAVFSAHAGNDSCNNRCGEEGGTVNNGGTGNGGSGYGGAGGHGGDGGNAVALGGSGGSVKDSGNSHNLNANLNQNDATSISGSKSIAQMASENSLKNKVNASSENDNRSSATGNTTVTNVGGDSTLVERNAPPVFLGNLTATMSCAGGFNAGASDRNGSGAFGFTWISADCRSVVIGREFVGIGMPDVACRVWKTTKGYKRAVKADPSLANVDCAVKPAAVIVPAPAVTFPDTSRKPRG